MEQTILEPTADQQQGEHQRPVAPRDRSLGQLGAVLVRAWERIWRGIGGWVRGHRRFLRRSIYVLVAFFVVAGASLAIAWNATPSTAGLMSWVRQQDALHHASYTPIQAIAPVVSQALIDTEDEHFYQHHGIDTLGLLRAAWDDLRAWNLVEGGSTLTGQLAKNAYLQGNDRTLGRKAEDLLLAVKIEQRYSKPQILEMYLNLVYFGDGTYGIGAASQRYFGIPPARLDLAQAALLAGLVQAPSYYDPYCAPAIAQDRRAIVLERMLADNNITRSQADAANREPLPRAAASSATDSFCAGA